MINTSKQKISADTILLLVILLVAAILRFWNISGMQYMHDELSAILRSQADSFSELIYKTKTTDVHPLGVPVFVHYWTKLFGTSEVAVKFPFIVFGLISIYYSYKIAEKWFNSTVAIIVIAFMATLQFPIMYGQLERPYASGMMLSVLMVWCWTNFFFGEKNKNRYATGFVVFASLCAYNHYFSLLFAVVVATTGFLLLNKENAKKYILMCVCVVLLFIPGIPVLIYHLSMGGRGEESWLGKPQPDWLLTFLKYLFHYSVIVYLLVGTLFLTSFYFINKERKVVDKMRIVALVWAFLVPALAYLFSIYKTPVLQFSTFTFSLPFLLMFVFSFYGELKKSIKVTVVSVIMIIICYTLCAKRKHFSVFYKQPYEEMVMVSENSIKEFGAKNVSMAHSAMAGFVDFYFEKYRKEFNYLRVDKPDTKAFLAYLEKEKTNYFVAGNLPLEYIQLIKERYPYIVKKEEGFTFSVYCFSKIKPAKETKEKVVFSETQCENENTSGHWEKRIAESEDLTHPVCMTLDSTKEYGAGFSAKLKDIIKSRHTILNVSAEINVENERANPVLVITIDDGPESLLWRGSEYKDYIKDNGRSVIYVSNLFSGTDLQKHPNARIKIYVWNRNKDKVWVNNFKVEAIESNPLIYSLYEPID